MPGDYFVFGGERGINFVDPRGGGFKAKINPDGFLLFSLQPLLKASFQRVFGKITIPPVGGIYFVFGGERGIRTPGTVSHTAV